MDAATADLPFVDSGDQNHIMTSEDMISPFKCSKGGLLNDETPGDKRAFAPFIGLMKVLQDFEQTVSIDQTNLPCMPNMHNDLRQGNDWRYFELELLETHSDPADTCKNIRDLLALVDIQLSLMHVELGRHLMELEANVLPFIHKYESLRKRCDAAFAVLQSRAPISEVCNLPNRRPHEAVMEWYSEHEEFFALHKQQKAIGRSYCQYPSALLNRASF